MPEQTSRNTATASITARTSVESEDNINQHGSTSTSNVIPGQPTEQLEIEDPANEDIEYPTGPQVWLNMIAILLVSFLHGLDLTIVAVVVPSLTNQFQTLEDIGWYSAVYGLIFSAMNFFFGKMYTLFRLKHLYASSIIIFELGSIICTFAQSSKMFILGRAVAGLGAAGLGAGAMTVIPRNFPIHKRPLMNGLFGSAQALGLVSAPVIGGALIDAFTWRACFGINIPIGIVAVIITVTCLADPFPNPDLDLPILDKIRRLDLIGTVLIIPAIVCLMLALQWGGIRYGWSDWRIIMLIILFPILILGFGYVQHRQGEKAVLPLRILRNRTVLASSLFSCCTNGLLATTEAYISVYFQGVRGFTATKSGLLGLPMIAGLAVTGMIAPLGITWIGYYTPFLFGTGVLAPIASGLLTTINFEESPAKVAALLGFVGAAVGVGNQCPATATMTVISPKEFPIAYAVMGFGGGLGSSLSVAASASLFQDRLRADLSHVPGVNVTSLGKSGLADIRKLVGPEKLRDALTGYNEAVVQTLYLPLGLALLTLVGAAFIEVKSVKMKRD